MKTNNFVLSLCIVAGWLMFSSFDFAEHKKIGDEAFNQLPYRLVEQGLVDTYDRAREVVTKLLKLQSDPTSLDGKILTELTQRPNTVSFGTLCALSGDHVSNPLLLETGLQTRYSRTNRTLALESEANNRFMTGAKSKELLDINPAYGMMAIRDLSHFHDFGLSFNGHLRTVNPAVVEMMRDPHRINEAFSILEKTNCIGKYFTIHYFAIHLAQEAGKAYRDKDTVTANDKMYYATLFEAFAEHFLQDEFASGHMFVNRGFTASAVVNNKALHDFYNKVPTQCTNLKGETWLSLGDKGLNTVNIKNPETYQYLRSDKQKLAMYEGLPDSLIDLTERKSKLLSQAVIATYTSMLEVWSACTEAINGSNRDVVEELEEYKNNLPDYIFKNSKVVYCMSIPFGSHRDEMPTEAISDSEVEKFDENIALPFSRGFIRSRVANSLMVILGVTDKNTFSIGGRVNLSMINFNTAHQVDNTFRKGQVIHWINPTLSGFYSHDADFIINPGNKEIEEFYKRISGADFLNYAWNLKGGVNYTCDIFVSDKRFLSLFSYIEGGVDVRDKVYDDPNIILNPDFSNVKEKYYTKASANATFVPTIGIQLGSLFGFHRFTVPSWIRIPINLILPLKLSASCHMTQGMGPMWSFNSEIDILF